jgi:hypothetical protein
MIRRIVFLSTVGMLVLTTSCKKTEALSGSDPSSGNAQLPIQPAQQPATETAPDTVMMSPPPMPETNQAPPANGKYPVMTFDKTEHDFGTINEGDKPTYSFVFKNTGASDLIISNAVGSCGCTVPEYPKEPVKPGESAKMKVSFNSAGKNGRQQKTVTIATNTASGKEMITIKANITPKAGSGQTSH